MKIFDPSSLQKYSVIKLPFQLGNESHTLTKRFVVICHEAEYAICLKATSKVEIYKNSKDLMAGCVYYQAGQLKVFQLNTAVQPDNQVTISHAYLSESHKNGSLDYLGLMPEDFEAKLLKAIKD